VADSPLRIISCSVRETEDLHERERLAVRDTEASLILCSQMTVPRSEVQGQVAGMTSICFVMHCTRPWIYGEPVWPSRWVNREPDRWVHHDVQSPILGILLVQTSATSCCASVETTLESM